MPLEERSSGIAEIIVSEMLAPVSTFLVSMIGAAPVTTISAPLVESWKFSLIVVPRGTSTPFLIAVA